MIRRGVVTRSAVGFAMVVALAFTALSAPASAQSADACAISRFTSPDGAVDVTSYLQCLNPSLSEDSAVPGGQVRFSGGGFASGSDFDVLFFSDPVLLGSFVAGSDGNFSVVVTIPSDATLGEHRLVAEGVDPDGNPLRIEKVIQVVSPAATPSTASGALPYTGSNTLQLVGVGVALVLVGGAVVVGIRRKNADPIA